ncbi:hypothetical protein [Salinisphaera sp. T31B1]|uniref:hypothetical protein n=1 Tax=Salinisphaera sp. T31B1 TaxID=727963 RepID=UPI003340956E
MAVVSEFVASAGFEAGDIATLTHALAAFRYPGGWCGWHAQASERGDYRVIDIVDPNDWEPLTLSRDRRGEYRAVDVDGHVVGQSESFTELLAELDILPC